MKLWESYLNEIVFISDPIFQQEMGRIKNNFVPKFSACNDIILLGKRKKCEYSLWLQMFRELKRSQKKCVKSPNMKNCNNLFDKQIFKIYQKTQKERQHLEGYGEKPLGSQSLFKKSQVTR